MFCRSAIPQPWWIRVGSSAAPVKSYWKAVLTISALAVVMCGRLSKTSAPTPGPPEKTPSAHIWSMSPKWPAVIGVAPLVPPKFV
jgi:hypothetical protein